MAFLDAAPPSPALRPRELQDPLNFYVFHPPAARLARALLPTAVSPNALSVAGCVCFLAAIWFYLEWPGAVGLVSGFALMLLWHVLDGADGDLARLRGTASSTGELVDGVCDYLGNTIMYFAFAFRLDDVLGVWAWVLAVAAGASHVVQTNHAETQRRLYLWRAYGRPWLRTAQGEDDPVFRRESWFTRWFGFWAVGYMWLSERMTPARNPIDEALIGAAHDPAELERLRAKVRDAYARILFLPKLLGANPKTLLIALSIAMGSPLYYFLAMLLILDPVLIVSILAHRRISARLGAALQGSPRSSPPAGPS